MPPFAVLVDQLYQIEQRRDEKMSGPKAAENVLAALAAQAIEDGAEPLTIRALIEEASENGAMRALAALGLGDQHAHIDIHQLRQLLMAWRDVQRTARRAIIGWLVKLGVSALLIALLIQLKLERIIAG